MSELKPNEVHPSAYIARDFIVAFLVTQESMLFREAIASTALSGDRHSQIAFETLRRLDAKEPVSDRYLMGLAWLIWSCHFKEKKRCQDVKKK